MQALRSFGDEDEYHFSFAGSKYFKMRVDTMFGQSTGR